MSHAAARADPQGFVTAAAISDMYEQQAAKIAEDRSTSPQVKQATQKMIHDHSSDSSSLQSILKQGAGANLTLPTQPDQRRQGIQHHVGGDRERIRQPFLSIRFART